MPGLSTSQSSFASTQGGSVHSVAPKTANKRSYDDEAEDDVDAYFDEVEVEEQTVPFEARRIAKLKSSPRKHVAECIAIFGSAVAVGDDFEEAAFLAPIEADM